MTSKQSNRLDDASELSMSKYDADLNNNESSVIKRSDQSPRLLPHER